MGDCIFAWSRLATSQFCFCQQGPGPPAYPRPPSCSSPPPSPPAGTTLCPARNPVRRGGTATSWPPRDQMEKARLLWRKICYFFAKSQHGWMPWKGNHWFACSTTASFVGNPFRVSTHWSCFHGPHPVNCQGQADNLLWVLNRQEKHQVTLHCPTSNRHCPPWEIVRWITFSTTCPLGNCLPLECQLSCLIIEKNSSFLPKDIFWRCRNWVLSGFWSEKSFFLSCQQEVAALEIVSLCIFEDNFPWEA